MCEWGTLDTVLVKIPADLSAEGFAKWKAVGIDRCIARLVYALQVGGVDMRGSCCGHGKGPGHIDLQDGRGLLILSPDQNAAYMAHAETLSGQIGALFASDDRDVDVEERIRRQAAAMGIPAARAAVTVAIEDATRPKTGGPR